MIIFYDEFTTFQFLTKYAIKKLSSQKVRYSYLVPIVSGKSGAQWKKEELYRKNSMIKCTLNSNLKILWKNSEKKLNKFKHELWERRDQLKKW